MADKYNAPQGPPPSYIQQPQQAYDGSNDPRAQQNYYGSPAPQQQYGSPAPYQQGGYPQGQYQQGPYGPPPPQQGMYYQQQPYGPQGGYYDNRGSGAGSGLCAGLMGALACCCCLDFCIF